MTIHAPTIDASVANIPMDGRPKLVPSSSSSLKLSTSSISQTIPIPSPSSSN
jgi:hypothetical protein